MKSDFKLITLVLSEGEKVMYKRAIREAKKLFNDKKK